MLSSSTISLLGTGTARKRISSAIVLFFVGTGTGRKRISTRIGTLTGAPRVTFYARGVVIRQFIPPQPPPFDWMVPYRTTNYIWPYPVLDERGRPR